MEDKMLIKKYRQLDYDLASVHSLLNSTRENRFRLFVPTESNCRIVAEQLNLLKNRIDALEVAGKPFEFIKNHWEQFTKRQAYTQDVNILPLTEYDEKQRKYVYKKEAAK